MSARNSGIEKICTGVDIAVEAELDLDFLPCVDMQNPLPGWHRGRPTQLIPRSGLDHHTETHIGDIPAKADFVAVVVAAPPNQTIRLFSFLCKNSRRLNKGPITFIQDGTLWRQVRIKKLQLIN